MATGGLKYDVCMLTAVSAPNQISRSSLLRPSWSFSITGRTIGRKTRMITGHSNGHPSTKKIDMISASFHQSPRGTASR